MKSFKLYLSLLLLMAFGMVGCQDNFDTPPIGVPVAQNKPNTTIKEIKAKYWDSKENYIDTIKVENGGEDIIIAGRVISSDATGNIYKNLVIQDHDADGTPYALTMSINANSLYNTYRVGQEIVINLTNMYIGKYSGLEQLGYPDYSTSFGWQATFMPLEFFESHVELNGLPDPTAVDTVTTTLTSLTATAEGLQKWQSQLIRLDDVTFPEANGTLTFSEADKSTNRVLQDAAGNTINVRNSNYATFKNDILPQGTGSVVGILSYFNKSWQLLLRSTADCIGFSTNTEGTKVNPYTIAAVKEMQGSTKKGWIKGYIVGAVAPEVTEVKSNSDIEWKAKVTLANTLVIGATADTKDIANCAIVSLAQGTALRSAANLVDNPTVYQKEILLNASAFVKVMGTTGVTTAGAASDFVVEGAGGGGGTGAGTEASPFTVDQVISGSATGSEVWVSGYIVGWVEGLTLSSGAKFNAEATAQTNILLAAKAGVEDVAACIPVQLPSGEIRSAVNLQTNPKNFGKKVTFKANIEKYFGATGLKTPTAYTLEGGSTEPEVPVDPVTTLDQSFTGITAISQLPGWKAVKISGDKNWWFPTFEGNDYASMTGFKGTTPPFEAWLITQPLNVKDAANKMLSFQTNVNGYESTTTKFEVYAMSTNDPATAKITKLNPTLPVAPPGKQYSGMTPSGNIDLSGMGDTVYIGFKYHATQDANYATWCVDDVKFGL